MLAEIRSGLMAQGALQPGDGMVIGVSGGADSVCLLCVLAELRPEFSLRLQVIHVHHGIRGAEADRDAGFTEALCRKLSVPCEIIYREVPRLAKERGLSEEETGRVLRYEALEECRERLGFRWIAVAHNREDNAETVLWNLCRGSGLAGLAGIRPVRGQILRPLLACSRKEIESWLAERGQEFCTDRTNLEEEYTRNRIRRRVLPLLEEEINTQSVRHITETAERLAVLQNYLEEQIDRVLEQVQYEEEAEEKESKEKKENKEERKKEKENREERENEEEKENKEEKENQQNSTNSLDEKTGISDRKRIIWNKEDYDACPEGLQAEAVLELLKRASGQAKNIHAEHVRAVRELYHKEVGKTVHLPYGMEARRTYTGICLERRGEEPKNLEGKKTGKQKAEQQKAEQQETELQKQETQKLETPPISEGYFLRPDAQGYAECMILEQKLLISARIWDCTEDGNRSILSVDKEQIYFSDGKIIKFPESSCTKWFDYDKIQHVPVIRTRKQGDSLVIHPDGRRKKLKDYWIDRKLPKAERDRQWLLADDSEILWILGDRTGEGSRVTADTRRIWIVELKKGEFPC